MLREDTEKPDLKTAHFKDSHVGTSYSLDEPRTISSGGPWVEGMRPVICGADTSGQLCW